MEKDIEDSQSEDDKQIQDKKDGSDMTAGDEAEISNQMSIWVWEAVLKFITRKEMADRVCLVCQYLKKLCWPRLHGKVAPHIVKELFFAKGDVEENGQTKSALSFYDKRYVSKKFPIATVAPPPDYILGFNYVHIDYLDAEVLKFIRNISPLLVNLHLFVGRFKNCAFHDLHSLLIALNGCPLACLDISSASISISQLHQAFPNLLKNIPALFATTYRSEDSIQLNELILAKLESGKPFIFKWRSLDGFPLFPLDKIRKAFETAVQPQSFMLDFTFMNKLTLDVFQLENERTGEVLAMDNYRLYRCPRGEVQKWTQVAANKFFSSKVTSFWIY